MKILLGADPELFLRNPNNGVFQSAHGKVPGTKYEPHKVPYGAVQIDGTALEFNIDPAASVDEFIHNIAAVRASLQNFVPGHNIVAEPVATFEEDYFKWDVPSTAKDLGCEPDFNAWTMEENPRPDPGDKPFRTGSGHIHIGWGEGFDIKSKEHLAMCGKVGRQMDYYLGIHSLLWDADPTRRLLYGKAGAFRPKSYGVEYRVLSNCWLRSEALQRWVYNAAQAGMNAAGEDLWAERAYGATARSIIDDNVTDWQENYPIFLDGLDVKIPA